MTKLRLRAQMCLNVGRTAAPYCILALYHYYPLTSFHAREGSCEPLGHGDLLYIAVFAQFGFLQTEKKKKSPSHSSKFCCNFCPQKMGNCDCWGLITKEFYCGILVVSWENMCNVIFAHIVQAVRGTLGENIDLYSHFV